MGRTTRDPAPPLKSSLTEVTGFRTTDGKIFDNRQAALAHQARLDLTEFLGRHWCGSLDDPSPGMVANILIDHLDDLKTILEDL